MGWWNEKWLMSNNKSKKKQNNCYAVAWKTEKKKLRTSWVSSSNEQEKNETKNNCYAERMMNKDSKMCTLRSSLWDVNGFVTKRKSARKSE